MDGWRRLASLRSIIKGKYMSSDRQGAISWEMIQRQLESDAEAAITSNRIRYVKVRPAPSTLGSYTICVSPKA